MSKDCLSDYTENEIQISSDDNFKMYMTKVDGEIKKIIVCIRCSNGFQTIDTANIEIMPKNYIDFKK